MRLLPGCTHKFMMGRELYGARQAALASTSNNSLTRPPAWARFLGVLAYALSGTKVLGIAVVCLLASSHSFAAEHQSGSQIYRTAGAIMALQPDQARHGYPAQIRGVVTQAAEEGMAIHDGTAGIWIYSRNTNNYSAGDDVEVNGVVGLGMYAPVIQAAAVRKLGRTALPKAQPVTLDQLTSGSMDAQYVSIVGVVRSAGIRNNAPPSMRVLIKLKVDGGFLVTTLPADEGLEVDKLVDAVVRVTATAMCTKNDNRQIIAPTLAASDRRSITVLRAPPGMLSLKPLTPINRLMQYHSGTDFNHRVRVAGEVTFYQPGESIILEDHGAALNIKTAQNTNIALGDRVEALGFPSPRASGPILEDGMLRHISAGPSLQPIPIKLADLCSGKLNYNLVSTQGHLLRQVHEPFREVFLIQSEPNILRAELVIPNGVSAMPRIPEGSEVRISGINVLDVDGTWNYGIDSANPVRCNLVLRSPADVMVIEPPTWVTTRHVVYIAIGFGIIALVFLVYAVRSLLERWKLHAAFAERERLGHDIHDTLAQSFAGIGFQLQAIRREVPRDLPHLQQQVELAQDLIRHSHKEARRSIEPLHLQEREAADLLPSLEECARKMVEGGTVEISMEVHGRPRKLPSDISTALLRIGQEAIANAVRHANPGHLNISLASQSNTVTLSIEDDGVGFVKSGDLLGFGLRGMRKRAAAISANVEILSQLGNGTRITVIAPLPPALTPITMVRTSWKYISEHLWHVNQEE